MYLFYETVKWLEAGMYPEAGPEVINEQVASTVTTATW